MIRSYGIEDRRLVPLAEPGPAAAWLDLVDPTPEDEHAAEAIAGIDLPTRADMEEIEASSRLYIEDGTAFLTAIVPAHHGTDLQEVQPVTFVLAQGRLVTIRYHHPKAFDTFPAWAQRTGADIPDAATLLEALLEAIVDRLADILELIVRDIDGISRSIFRPEAPGGRDMQRVLEAIGRAGDLTSQMRDSLLSFDRLVGFLTQMALQGKWPKDRRERLKTLSRDVRSLLDHAGFNSTKVTFLLDAALGMINIEQNAIIKIFSVAAVIFLPPTLVATIYGMNFHVMPELDWSFGYPLAIALMVLSAILPYWFFRRRGWL